MNINSVVLAGRLCRDVQLKFLPSGAVVAELGVVVNRSWVDKQSSQKREEATFVDCTVFGPQAEATGTHLTKGSELAIEGRLQLDTWEDKQTGQKRSKLRVVAERVHFGTRTGNREGQSPQGGGAPQQGDAGMYSGAPEDTVPF